MVASRSISENVPGPALLRALEGEHPLLLTPELQALGGHGYVLGTDGFNDPTYDIVQDVPTGTFTKPSGYDLPAMGIVPVQADTYLDFPNVPSKELFEVSNAMSFMAIVQPVRPDLTTRKNLWAFSDGSGNSDMCFGMFNNDTPTGIVFAKAGGSNSVNQNQVIPGGATDPDRWALICAIVTDTTEQVICYRFGDRSEGAVDTRASSIIGSAVNPLRVGWSKSTPQDLPVFMPWVGLGAATVEMFDEFYLGRVRPWFSDMDRLI